jgi:hypothetical protein
MVCEQANRAGQITFHLSKIQNTDDISDPHLSMRSIVSIRPDNLRCDNSVHSVDWSMSRLTFPSTRLYSPTRNLSRWKDFRYDTFFLRACLPRLVGVSSILPLRWPVHEQGRWVSYNALWTRLMKNTGILLLLWFLPAVSANAQTIRWGPSKTVQFPVPHPPEFELSVKRIAFGEPSGNCASDATELVDRMILPDFQQNQMDVIERQALDQIMAEHNFNQSAYADASSAARLGKILGPSALIIVNINTCRAEQIPLYEDEKNFSGGITRILISKTRFSMEGSIRVVNLTTGQVLGSHNFESKPEKSNTSQNGQPEFPPIDVVKDSAMQANQAPDA